MRYVERLREEHEDIQTVLAIMAEMSNRLQADSSVEPQDLAKVVSYLEEFVLRGHIVKEERYLYPALQQAGVPGDSGPLAVMVAEHQMGTNFLGGLKDAAVRYRPGDPDDERIIGEYARNFALLFAQHMEEEEQVVYRVAEQRLPEQTRRRLDQQFQSHEFEMLGAQGHERYHGVAHDLAELYLN